MERQPSTPPGGEQPPIDPNTAIAEATGLDQVYQQPAAEQHASPLGAGSTTPGTPEAVVAAGAAATGTEQVGRAAAEPVIEQLRSNKEILAVVKKTIELVADQVRRNENRPGIRELGRRFLASDDMQAPAGLLYRATAGGELDLQEVRATAADNAVFYLWSKSKVAYAMDDLLLSYLSESSVSQIPTQVLRSLPHADPYLLLPKADFDDEQTAYYRTHIGIPLGAFVFGRYNRAQQLCSTADDKREDLGLMFFCVRDSDAGPDPVTLRCTIPLHGPTFTVEDAVSATVAKFNFNDDLAEDDPAKLNAWLRTYVTQAFNSLLYVCTEQSDVEVYQPGASRPGKVAKSRQQRRPRPDDIGTVVKLGFRMGPALHEAQARWERSQRQQQAGDPSGRHVRPHQKRAHYRTYWTGAGRTKPVTRWIAPFWVNEDLLGTTDEPKDVVVRPVRKHH